MASLRRIAVLLASKRLTRTPAWPTPSRVLLVVPPAHKMKVFSFYSLKTDKKRIFFS